MPLLPPPQSLIRELTPLLRSFLLRLADTPIDRSTRVTSWYRSPLQNLEVGGAPESQHLAGLAIDVVNLPPGALRVLANAGLVVVPFASHVHVQLGPAGFLRAQGLLELVRRA